MKCEFCGNDLPENETRCPECGAETAAAAAIAPQPEAPEAAPAEQMPVMEVAEEAAPAEPEVPASAVAVEMESIPAPAKAPKIKKKRHILVRILCGLLAIVLMPFMILSALGAVTILNLQNITKQEVINQILSGILTAAPVASPFPNVIAPLTAGGTGGFDIGDLTGEDGADFIVDFVYDMVKDQYGDEMNITKEDMNAFLEESTAKEFVVEKVSGLVSDMINGTNETTITTEEIKNLVQENADLVKEHFNVEITPEQIDQVSQVIEDTGILETIEEEGLLGVIQQMGGAPSVDPDAPNQGGDASDPNQGGAEGDGPVVGPSNPGNDGSMGGILETIQMIKEALELFRQIASTQNFLIFLGIFLFLSLLLFFLNGRGIPGTLFGMGLPILLAGGIYSAPGLICSAMPETVITILADAVEGGAIIGKAVVTVFNVILPLNLIVLGIGGGLILLSILTKIIKSARNRKAA